ncbi:30S ribosomal protein S8 [Candidatus Woesebacteria bacterium]|nr:MAG: 30S ribosomal protein S8 [Candidatus Woesebacteria bacterium]
MKKSLNQTSVKRIFRNVNYPIGDFLIQIKNASLAGNEKVSVAKTKYIKSVAEALKKERYLTEVVDDDGVITVTLAFHKKEPLLFGLKLVSRPGLRRYMSVDDLEKHRGPETLILSTAHGVLSSKDAIKLRVGGEVIAKIW